MSVALSQASKTPNSYFGSVLSGTHAFHAYIMSAGLSSLDGNGLGVGNAAKRWERFVRKATGAIEAFHAVKPMV